MNRQVPLCLLALLPRINSVKNCLDIKQASSPRPPGPFEWGPQRLLILWREPLAELVLQVVQRHGGELRRRQLTRAVIAAIRPRPTPDQLPRCRAAIGDVVRRLLESDELIWVSRSGETLRGQLPSDGERVYALRVAEDFAFDVAAGTGKAAPERRAA